MADLKAVLMSRNGASTPSTEAERLMKSTEGSFAGFGLGLSTGLAEIAVDPDDKVGFVVIHQTSCTGAGTLTLSAGPNWQKDVGDKAFSVGSSATGDGNIYFLGPFESAKYVLYDSTAALGKPCMKFTLTGAGSSCFIMAFKMPTVTYST